MSNTPAPGSTSQPPQDDPLLAHYHAANAWLNEQPDPQLRERVLAQARESALRRPATAPSANHAAPAQAASPHDSPLAHLTQTPAANNARWLMRAMGGLAVAGVAAAVLFQQFAPTEPAIEVAQLQADVAPPQSTASAMPQGAESPPAPAEPESHEATLSSTPMAESALPASTASAAATPPSHSGARNAAQETQVASARAKATPSPSPVQPAPTKLKPSDTQMASAPTEPKASAELATAGAAIAHADATLSAETTIPSSPPHAVLPEIPLSSQESTALADSNLTRKDAKAKVTSPLDTSPTTATPLAAPAEQASAVVAAAPTVMPAAPSPAARSSTPHSAIVGAVPAAAQPPLHVSGMTQNHWQSELWRAVQTGKVHDASFAIEQGAGVNAVDATGFTPLMRAAERGDLNMVQTLLRLGASREARNQRGQTALDLAREKGHTPITKALQTDAK